jgi:hypothetical protein
MFVFGGTLVWLFTDYPEFSFGLFTGISLMAVLFFLAELGTPRPLLWRRHLLARNAGRVRRDVG